MERRALPKPDISEHGAPKNGVPQTSDRRLFMQLLAFGDAHDTDVVVAAVKGTVQGAVYQDLADPRGIALLTLSEEPDFFVGPLRRLLSREPFSRMSIKHEYTMFGRTYALGYEPDLDETLLSRPRRTVLNPAWPWAVWYPLRRSGRFSQLAPDEQRKILMEHGTIGMSFGAADYAHDVRLACHGLDKHDNDFVIGLIGKELYPLSAIVQAMRRTTQTSLYLERLGPFFVGKAVWQSPA